MFSLFAQLICCGKRSRAIPPDAPSTVIPNERTPLLDDPREQAPDVSVDHQSLSDRLGTIVRAKEGKMVSVSSRTPFTLHDAEQAQLPTTSTANEDDGVQDVTISRRPPVLTMTPARSHGSFSYLRSDSQSQHSSESRSGSRSPSRQRAQSGSSVPPSSSSGRRSGAAARRFKSPDRSEWFAESESEVEVSVDDESVSPTPHSPTSKTPTAPPAPILQIQDVKGIAFDWDS
ncbi:hypothetical protein R3P38DRAFT_1050186 [Favolaschia claudopus]|uniref:Uncharacterized protein n=1 Tax=Favolaschia claudopus TaxID=2862362 RepID=A0AAW0BE17_9AGAR